MSFSWWDDLVNAIRPSRGPDNWDSEGKFKPKPKSNTARKRKPPIMCPTPLFTPHHRNLGLKPWASDNDVRTAWRHISVRLHPDKIRDPSQKEAAAAAMLLINDAHDILFRQKQNRGSGYWWINDWTQDPDIDHLERTRRIKDSQISDNSDQDSFGNQEGCEFFVARKPAFLVGQAGYNTYAECEAEGGFQLCGEFWVDLQHKVIDNVMPLPFSDWIWNMDGGWRVPSQNRQSFEVLEFYGNCFEHFSVKLPVTSGQPDKKWSHYRDTPCAETQLNFHSIDGWLLIITFVIFLILARNLLLKSAKAGLKGLNIAKTMARDISKGIDRAGRMSIKLVMKTVGWLFYLTFWWPVKNSIKIMRKTVGGFGGCLSE